MFWATPKPYTASGFCLRLKLTAAEFAPDKQKKTRALRINRIRNVQVINLT